MPLLLIWDIKIKCNKLTKMLLMKFNQDLVKLNHNKLLMHPHGLHSKVTQVAISLLIKIKLLLKSKPNKPIPQSNWIL